MTDKERTEAAILPLLYWYGANARVLPWRSEPTPYHVLLSEIMLQQTRVEAVLPYYERFLAVCPDMQALSRIDDDALMKLWEGLGYYSRARNLKKAAIRVMEMHDGVIPCEHEALLSLPGIGAYTAGAISSIAFGKPYPAVDGNVLRVMTRLLAIDDDISLPETKKAITSLLSSVYARFAEDASSLTQGLMELGATVCIPNGAPRCESCPWTALCEANRLGKTDCIPKKAPKKPRKIEEKTVLLLRCGEECALEKRPSKGLLSSLWVFPLLDSHLSEEEIKDRFGDAISTRDAGRAKHIFTHIEWEMIGYEIEIPSPLPEYEWKSAAQIAQGYAIPSALRHYLKQIHT